MTQPRPLDGIRVLEVGQLLAGPFAGSLLAADKIEPRLLEELNRSGSSDIVVVFAQQADLSAAEHLGWRERGEFVYDELRKLAAAKLAHEKPGQTLQATALVHEAYLRLVDVEQAQQWDSRGHFFAAAGEAMRRILVEQARRKRSMKSGGGRNRHQT